MLRLSRVVRVILPLMVMILGGGTARPARADFKDVAANATGLFLNILVHETGHAATATALGWKVTDFRPYPHLCGGRLVGGCVLAVNDEPEFDEDGRFNRRYLIEERQVAGAGSLFSNASVLALAPLQKSFRASGFAGMTLGWMLVYQNYDWLFYTLTDSFTGFEGDWHAVAQTLDVPTYYFIAPAALNFWLLKRYRLAFARSGAVAGSKASVPILLPRVAVSGPSRALSLVLEFAMELP